MCRPRAPRPRRQNAILEALRKDAPTAQISPATEGRATTTEGTGQPTMGNSVMRADIDFGYVDTEILDVRDRVITSD
jgi:hypothetical protein